MLLVELIYGADNDNVIYTNLSGIYGNQAAQGMCIQVVLALHDKRRVLFCHNRYFDHVFLLICAVAECVGYVCIVGHFDTMRKPFFEAK